MTELKLLRSPPKNRVLWADIWEKVKSAQLIHAWEMSGALAQCFILNSFLFHYLDIKITKQTEEELVLSLRPTY